MKKRVATVGTKNLVGLHVESFRKQKGLKQKDLADALAEKGVTISASGLSKLERQVRMVSDIELIALADVLNVPVGALLEANDTENK